MDIRYEKSLKEFRLAGKPAAYNVIFLQKIVTVSGQVQSQDRQIDEEAVEQLQHDGA